MTTINTPGIYGAYSFGVAPLTFLREPMFYPAYNDRETIPAITVTVAPLRDATTASGAPTLQSVSPSGTREAPAYAALSTMRRPEPLAPPESSSLTTFDNVARVVVRVPENARLEFGGVPIEQSGRVRKFVTPLLVPGQKYRYDIRAIWNNNGQEVVKERQINVFAGEKADVDFLSPYAEEEERELRSQPIPGTNRSGVKTPGTPPVPPAQQLPVSPPLTPTIPPTRP
jgi:uncharacterized protein (TIGR03000 family)